MHLIKNRQQKEWAVLGMVMLAVLGAVFYVVSRAHLEQQAVLEALPAEFSSGVHHADLKSYFTQQINQKIDAQEKKVHSVEQDILNLNQAKEERVTQLEKENALIKADFMLLKEQLMEIQAKPMVSSPSGQVDLPPIPELQRGEGSDPFSSVLERDEMEVVSVQLEGADAGSQLKDIRTYVPSGTYIRGVILGGVDAHTEVYGNAQTRVVTIRFNDGGHIPNGFSGSLKDCVLLASAWGNASSERVAIRGERLSCVGETGKALETPVVATVYGPDGRQDVRGRVVYPEGKLIERAFIAGSLSGIGNGIGDQFKTTSISPLGSITTVNPSDIFKQGASAGVGKGLDKLSDYYIKRAEQLQPIIQIGAGTEVDVVIQKGFYLDGAAPMNRESVHEPVSVFETQSLQKASQQAAQTMRDPLPGGV